MSCRAAQVSSEIMCFSWHYWASLPSSFAIVEIGFPLPKFDLPGLSALKRPAAGRYADDHFRPPLVSLLEHAPAAAATKKCISSNITVTAILLSTYYLIFLHWTITTGNWTKWSEYLVACLYLLASIRVSYDAILIYTIFRLMSLTSLLNLTHHIQA